MNIKEMNSNMAIRLTEQDLHRIVKESVNTVLNEAFKSNILRDLHNSIPNSSIGWHGARNFRNKTSSDAEAHGLPTRNGLYTSGYLDKITDDMIETVGTREELSRMGYTFGSHNTWYGIGSQEVYDSDGKRRYAMIVNNGKMVIFKNDPNTINRLKELSSESGEKYSQREANKRHDGKNDYQWSTKERGTAFDDWKNTGRALWDSDDFKKTHRMNGNWRKDSWVKQNMDKALKSYNRDGNQ